MFVCVCVCVCVCERLVKNPLNTDGVLMMMKGEDMTGQRTDVDDLAAFGSVVELHLC